MREHGLEVLETGQGEMAREVNDRLRFLSESLAAARAARFEKQSEAEVAPTASRDVTGPLAETLGARLADLRRERAKLASSFHDEYQAVKALNSQIRELESALDAEAARAVSRVRRKYRAAVRREALLEKRAQSTKRGGTGHRAELDRLPGVEARGRDQPAAVRAPQPEVKGSEHFGGTQGLQRRHRQSAEAASQTLWLAIRDQHHARHPRRPAAGGRRRVRAGAHRHQRAVGGGHRQLPGRADPGLPSPVSRLRASCPPAPWSGRPARGARIDREGQGAAPLSEAFAALRTAVVLDDDGLAQRVLLVTSAQSEEGKTTVAINLALSLAHLKNRVLLVDANMRVPVRPRGLRPARRTWPGRVPDDARAVLGRLGVQGGATAA